MSTPTPHQVLRQVISAFDQGDWTIFDFHPGLYETHEHSYASGGTACYPLIIGPETFLII